ncbi:MAG: class I SAM-dependent methyltransferase [Alphaproteobacteria bacterium]
MIGNGGTVREAIALYTSERGAQYYAQRAALRSTDAQRERAELFADLADAAAVILDFGCGNGGVLAQLSARRRIGIEVSPYAINDARERLDCVASSLEEIPDSSVDVAISFHALEHVTEPALVLQNMFRVLKPGGRMRIVVPCEMPALLREHRRWRRQDTNMHLFGWTPLTLGNLLTVCGFEVAESGIVPASAGGRIGRMLGPKNSIRKLLAYAKALISGRFHTVVTATKTAIHPLSDFARTFP